MKSRKGSEGKVGGVCEVWGCGREGGRNVRRTLILNVLERLSTGNLVLVIGKIWIPLYLFGVASTSTRAGIR